MSATVAASPRVFDLDALARPLVQETMHQILRQRADQEYGAGKWKEEKFIFHGFYTGMRQNPGLSVEVGPAEYDLPDIDRLPGTDELFWSTNDVDNYSPTETLVAHPVIRNNRSRTFTWGLTQSLKIGGKATVKIPLVGETELTTEVALGGHETWSTSVQQSVDFTVDVPCPPRTRTTIQYVLSLKELTIEWQVPVSLTCRAWALLAAHGPKSISTFDYCLDVADVLTKEQNRFLVKGTTNGAMGFHGRLDARPHPLPEDQASSLIGGLTGDALARIVRIEAA